MSSQTRGFEHIAKDKKNKLNSHLLIKLVIAMWNEKCQKVCAMKCTR